MANTHTELTGVLKLRTVTPVIQALFGALDLDETCPGNGQVYFGQLNGQASPDWNDILYELEDLATTLNALPSGLPDDTDLRAKAALLLPALAAHFRAQAGTTLDGLIERTNFDYDDPDYEALFTIATAFDDGHGLTGIKYEVSWHCDKPHLFEFGGMGRYIGAHASVSASSTDAAMLGETLDATLAGGETHKAAQALHASLNGMLQGITDAEQRTEVRLLVAKLLQAPTPTEGTHRAEPRGEMDLSTESLRGLVAEAAWDRHDFGQGAEIEGVNGWEHATHDNEWTRTAFIRTNTLNVGRSSERVRFVVRFLPDSAVVEEVFAHDHSGNDLGSQRARTYYVWHDEGDCQNATKDLVQAATWCRDFLQQGRQSYITYDDNMVLNLDGLYRVAPQRSEPATPATIYVEAYSVNEADSSPRFARFEVTADWLADLRGLQSLSRARNLTEVRVAGGPEWGPEGWEEEHRIGCHELVVSSASFWFTAIGKHADASIETRPVDIAEFNARLQTHPVGQPLYLCDREAVSDEEEGDEDADA